MSKRAPHVFDAPKDGAPIFWKSLEEKANPEQAAARATAELETPIGERDLALGRRGFLTLSAITTALFAEGCARRPVEKILPYARTPEQTIPGVSAHFATVLEHRGEALGVLVESTDGRPTLVAGNPDHPESLGGTDASAQAELWNLYDPDRTRAPHRGLRGAGPAAKATHAELEAALADLVRGAQADQGARLRFLVEPTSSPTFARVAQGVKNRFPKAKLHGYTPVSDANVAAGAKLAFGTALRTRYELGHAKTILALDSDFLDTEAGSVRHARGFAVGRKPKSPTSPMNRLYAVEPSFTLTGMNADHRLRLAGSHVPAYALALAKELAAKHGVDLGGLGQIGGELPSVPKPWIEAVAKDLAASRGASLVIVGPRQPAFVHALAHALNVGLGNLGRTVTFHGPKEVATATRSVDFAGIAAAADTEALADVTALAEDIQKGLVGTLIILGGNPAYDAPADLDLAAKIKTVGTVLHLADGPCETCEVATWIAPRAHALESWGDATSTDGTVSIRQPLIAPLFDGLSDIELLARFTNEPSTKGVDLVKATYKAVFTTGVGFQKAWNEGLQKGVVAHRTAGRIDGAAVRTADVETAARAWKAPPAPTAQALEVAFAPCPRLHDGRHANNAFLLELPDPVSKLAWDNAAYVSPGTAKELGVVTGDMLRLGEGKVVDVAVFVLPGQADGVLSIALGWGRQVAGRYGHKHGFDAYPLRTTAAPWFLPGVKATMLDAGAKAAIEDRYRKPGLAAGDSPAAGRTEPNGVFDVATGRYKLIATQEHGRMEGRPVAVDATLAEYRKVATFPQYPNEERKDLDQHGEQIPVRKMGSPNPKVLPLWNKRDYSKGHKWGMVIDLSGCTGCNACVIACQSENNIAVVGKEQVARGREMSWIRIDRYFVGLDENDPQIAFQPVACVQCEEAPCENVCPVNATEHSPEGLNDMAYNRCIGTRYCANNCPYKVRRFNWLNYHAQDGEKDFYADVPDTEQMRFNPNVTVRFRGVMEKCNYCVQRIQEAKIVEKRSGVAMKDGDVRSACEEACPSGVIAFGDLNDPKSKVSEWRARDRNYALLAELGTGPRTTYLGKIRNPNPDMGAKA